MFVFKSVVSPFYIPNFITLRDIKSESITGVCLEFPNLHEFQRNYCGGAYIVVVNRSLLM